MTPAMKAFLTWSMVSWLLFCLDIENYEKGVAGGFTKFKIKRTIGHTSEQIS